jgi:predicted DNA-binding protein (MmcQ/YjbR family)
MTNQQFAKLALSFQGVIEMPHFDRRAFKIVTKRIFATLHEASGTANLKFSPQDQSVYSLIDKKSIYPIKNKWGLQGWTTFELKNIDKQLMLDALDTAYKEALKSGLKKSNRK